MVDESPNYSAMHRTKVLIVVSLLLFTGIGQATLFQQSDSTVPAGPELEIAPSNKTIQQNQSAVFFFYVTNPSNRSMYVLLFIGSSAANDEIQMKIDGKPPEVEFEKDMTVAWDYSLDPHERRLVPIVVESGSNPGDHIINATAVYVLSGNHERKRVVSSLNVEPLPCSLSCQLDRWWESAVAWVIKYRNVLLSILGLIVAILSFFGYERVRKSTKTPTELGEKSTRRERDREER